MCEDVAFGLVHCMVPRAAPSRHRAGLSSLGARIPININTAVGKPSGQRVSLIRGGRGLRNQQ